MALRKTAFALPEDLLAAVDRAAESRGQTRNRFVTLVLQEAVRARRDAEVAKRLNRLFAEDGLAAEQIRTASALDAIGSDWSDERW